MRIASTIPFVVTLAARSVGAQDARIPIRPVTPAAAVSAESFGAGSDVRELAGGRILIDDGANRRLLMFDASFQNRTVLADTSGAFAPYPRASRLIPYRGDTILFFEFDSRSLVAIGPDGRLGRVMALPKEQDANRMTNSTPVGTDAKGRLVYAGARPFRFPPSCRVVDGQAVRSESPAVSDSIAIVRADFETRSVDTIGRAKVAVAGITFPALTTDGSCKALSAKVRIDPSVPESDSWTVTSDGVVAIVRGHDYHVDWIDANGALTSTPKMAFDWRRITDADKKARIDSAKHVVDSLTAIGGYRLQACGNSMSFNTNPPNNAGPGGGGAGGGGGGVGGGRGGAVGVAVSSAGVSGGGDAPPAQTCQTLTAAAEFPAFDEMPNYLAPVREASARADRDGNVWILPTTSSSAQGGLLYDVVNRKGEIVERVQLPADRALAGFGKNGVIFLAHVSGRTATIERVSVVRK